MTIRRANSMSGMYKDNYTQMLETKITDWGLDRIYEIEEDISALEEREPELIEYLKDIRYSMPLGTALRRYICNKFGKPCDGGYSIELFDGNKYFLKDYQSENYDLQNDDVKEYVEIFQAINEKYNTSESGELLLEIPKPEIRRLLRSTTSCVRSKMFLLSFALHMKAKEMKKFLTDVLAEQTYNYRDPEEIIALYCQSNESINTYGDYLRIKQRFNDAVKASKPNMEQLINNYTEFAVTSFENSIKTEDDLVDFLVINIPNFAGYSQTAYNEFMILYDKAIKKSKLPNINGGTYELVQVTNSEQLARAMYEFVPRVTYKRQKNNKTIYSNDFIPISNGEAGQKSKKIQTTALPKEITMNMLVSDRLEDLRKERKPVTRKDLVFMKFYVFSRESEEKGSYTSSDYLDFIDECNAMLVRCGMSRLYPANRFENLIMLSLLSSIPFEMFENIIEYSFMNEAEFG